MDKVIAETEEARKLIREVDPLGPSHESYTEKGYDTDDYVQGGGFWLYRKSKLNYYGMTAFLARVYLYKGGQSECAGMCEGGHRKRKVFIAGRKTVAGRQYLGLFVQ